MEIRQLRYAVAVARNLSFTRAAEALAVAQPALSQQIGLLERELGVRLFDRTNRRVAATDAGRAFVARAERVIAELAAVAEEMSAYSGGIRGRVVIGTYQSFAEYTLPKLLGRFHGEHPGIEVALREGLADDLLAALRNGVLDVFIGDLSDTEPAEDHEFEHAPLYEDELAIAVASSHPLASRNTVRIEELRDESFIIFRPGSQMTQRLNALARAAGFVPRVAFESVDTLTVRSLVAERLGIALFPRTLGNTPGPNIALVSLAPKPLLRRMSIVTRRMPLSPSAQRFIDFIREEQIP